MQRVTPVMMWLSGLILILACALAGCGEPKTSDRDLVLIDSADAPGALAGKSNLLGFGARHGAWVDPRSPAQFAKGHIASAISMPFPTLADDHKMLSDYNLLIVYGDGYRDPLAEATAKRLIELGHKDVRVLRGGLQAWTAEGNALETGTSG